MTQFKVTTNESVKGTYTVEAEDLQKAISKFTTPKSIHEGMEDGTIEQDDYQCFHIDTIEAEGPDGQFGGRF
jgi:hypothetical protein